MPPLPRVDDGAAQARPGVNPRAERSEAPFGGWARTLPYSFRLYYRQTGAPVRPRTPDAQVGFGDGEAVACGLQARGTIARERAAGMRSAIASLRPRRGRERRLREPELSPEGASLLFSAGP